MKTVQLSRRGILATAIAAATVLPTSGAAAIETSLDASKARLARYPSISLLYRRLEEEEIDGMTTFLEHDTELVTNKGFEGFWLSVGPNPMKSTPRRPRSRSEIRLRLDDEWLFDLTANLHHFTDDELALVALLCQDALDDDDEEQEF